MTETSKQMQYTETANIPVVDMPSCGHSVLSISGFTSKEILPTYMQQMFTYYKQPHTCI